MSSANAEPSGAAPNDSSSQGTDNSPAADPAPAAPPRNNNDVPKPKRLACIICRKRKLRCDGIKPSCSTCTRLGHSCAYDEVRRKSGPKRGYVKALEERLKQVEELLKTQEPPANTCPDATKTPNVPFQPVREQQPAAAAAASASASAPGFNFANPSIAIASDRDMGRWHFNTESPQANGMDDFNFASNMSMGFNGIDQSFTWEMIGLGLEEPLPPQETIDELHQIYFDKIHPSIPMIHQYRYLAAMNLAPNQRPPVALRYAIWTMACSITEKYADLTELFYQRARRYVEADYIKGYGEHLISVAHCQTHTLLASYEFKMMYFPRAWMSTGSAVRLAQMIGLHRLDGSGLDVKQCLPPPRDWTEREERRRTFWMAFCEDRYASIGTGWPMTIDERDIMTNLPASETAFNMSRPEQTQTLAGSMSPAGAAKLSSLGGIVLMACLFGRNLTHLHRPDAEDRDHDMNGEFWKRHRNMDNILLNTSLCLPNHLKLPTGLSNPNIVFTNMNIHTSTICLHQAAIFKADKNRLPATVSGESKMRCITAANEIASIMRMVSHLDLSAMNPFLSFCLYVAARVFVQYLKSRPDDCQTADSLRFLLAAMKAFKRKNPLTESFLVQLDVDLEALSIRIPKLKAAFPRSTDSPGPRIRIPQSFAEKAKAQVPMSSSFIMTDDVPLTDAEKQNQGPNTSGSKDLGLQAWLPRRDRGTTRSENENSEPSNQPTPNSSNASEQRSGATGSGPMATPSRTSFDASSMGSQQNMATASDLDAAAAAAFFADNGFGMGAGTGTGMTPGRGFSMADTVGHDFTVGEGWDGAGLSPGPADGTMRNLSEYY
ncbi:fungal-specific transcription factor [Xylariaceae sp. FL0804]|nr:fungal-specific transcription factor [Xylariaceae sp. FL0804]